MTDKTISPLRQRKIEDYMTARHFAEKAGKDYIPIRQELRSLPRPLACYRHQRVCLSVSIAHDEDPRGRAEHQHCRRRAPVLLQSDARTGGFDPASDVGAPACGELPAG